MIHRSRRLFCCLLALTICLAGLAQSQTLDISNWQLIQANSTATFTFPVGTVLNPGDYVVLGRHATQNAFEAHYGVVLGSNVHYLTNGADSPVVPMINGAEQYTLRDATGTIVDGPTASFNTGFVSHHRDDPEALGWTLLNSVATPGAGVEAPDAVYSGLVITEAANGVGAGNFIYEFVELYYDASSGGGGGGNLAPVLSAATFSPNTPADGDTIVLTVTATDVDGTVAGVACSYRFGAGTYLATPMTSGGGSLYTLVLPAVTGSQLLEYYFVATDNIGATGIDPVGAPVNTHSVWIQGLPGASKIVLFDHSHSQDAGQHGNWRIDDNFPDPLPAQPTAETAWSGQLSSWAYELYLAGHIVRSTAVPLSNSVLAGVQMLVIPEPQDPFSAAEIEAVRQFVFNGGSLFFVADHNRSDRNQNGWDSASIFGGYSTSHISVPVGTDTETFCGALFGLHMHVAGEANNSFSGTFTNVNADPANPVIHGPYGTVTSVVYHVGNSLSLWPAANPDLTNVGGLVSLAAGSPHVAAWSQYGAGKVFGFGESSDMADGTGTESHFNNWIEASHRALFLNASTWLLADPLSGTGDTPVFLGLALKTWPNPFNPAVNIRFELATAQRLQLRVFDLAGHLVNTLADRTFAAGPHTLRWSGRDQAGRSLPSGVYFVQAFDGTTVGLSKVVLTK